MNASAPEALLGNTTESVVGLDSIRHRLSGRIKAYSALRSARNLFLNCGEKAGLEWWDDFHRTAKCRHMLVDSGLSVNKVEDRAFYGGHMVCRNVWACPVCASVIANERERQIKELYQSSVDCGYQALMVTFTVPHYSFQKCSDVLEKFIKALKKMRSYSSVRKMQKEHGYIGLVRSLEVKFGRNGWHPHTHELWFVSPGQIALQSVQEKLAASFLSACLKVGLPIKDTDAFLARSVRVDLCNGAAGYITKQGDSRSWGVAKEMTKGIHKKGGSHPFQLLADYASLTGSQKSKAASLYLEYVESFKGKPQIYISPAVKKEFLVDDFTDEEAVENAESSDSPDSCLGWIHPSHWKIILKTESRALVLHLAETCSDDLEFADQLFDRLGVDLLTIKPAGFDSESSTLCLTANNDSELFREWSVGKSRQHPKNF